MALIQKREHEPEVVFRAAGPSMVDLEGGNIYPVHRLDDEVANVVFWDPVVQVGGEEEALVSICFNEVGYAEILWLRGGEPQERFGLNSEPSKGFGRIPPKAA